MKFRIFVFLLIATLANPQSISAQSDTRYIRIAKLVIDSSKLDQYNSALKEHAAAAVKIEPGVLMLYAVQEKDHPERISVFEIYASVDAYRFHIKTPHFLKYKSAVENMVKSLELIDVLPVALEAKPGIH
jgi:quinol monooxygenase YgiN